MKMYLPLLFLSITIGLPIFSQNALFTPDFDPNEDELFSESLNHEIYIDIDPDSLAVLLAPENRDSNHEYMVSMTYTNDTASYRLDSIGFRLRGNTSRGAQKKSFKISINSFIKGRKFLGVEKLNINGQQNDPSIARSKISSILSNQLGIPSMQVGHTRLYINGMYWGLYTNVEHIDEVFVRKRFGNNDGNLYKCLFPADLTHQGADGEDYQDEVFGRRPYELKTNEEEDDYTDLANFITILNRSSIEEFPCDLERVFNVDAYLKAIVLDILIGNWDGPIYNKNNFYLYHNVETGQFEYIPFDLDNTLGIDWIGRDWATRNIYTWAKTNEARPLYRRILEVEEYRTRFTWYMQEALLEIYAVADLQDYMDSLRSKLRPYVEIDPLFPLDFGFTMDDYDQSYDESLNFPHTAYGIRSFMDRRQSQALSQMDGISNVAPTVRSLSDRVLSNEFLVEARALDDKDGLSLTLEYKFENEAVASVPMQLSAEGRYVASISYLDQERVSYRVKVVDSDQSTRYHPRCYQNELLLQSTATLAINEIMASNASTYQDEAGEYDDWIEIYNYGEDAVFLGDKYLSDKEDNPSKWAFPDISIAPKEFLIIWADEDGSQGDLHSNFKLGKNGETIGIYDSDAKQNTPIDLLTYTTLETDEALGRIPDGNGNWQKVNPTPGRSNLLLSNQTQVLKEFSIFPNPARNFINVELAKYLGSKELTYTLVNSFGVEVSMGVLKSDLNKLNIENIPEGVYFLTIFDKGQIQATKKVLVIK